MADPVEKMYDLLDTITSLGFECKSDSELIQLADKLFAHCTAHRLRLPPSEYTKVLYYRERAYLNTMRYVEALKDIHEWLAMYSKCQAGLLTAQDVFGEIWTMLMDAGKAHSGIGDIHGAIKMFCEAFKFAEQRRVQERLGTELGLILARTENPRVLLQQIPNPDLAREVKEQMRW